MTRQSIKMNCIPRNKHFIKHRVVNKCNKINCCSNVDLRIKTHRINNRDVTFGPVVLSKDLLRILQNHVKKIAINSSQKHFYLTCRICNKILISKYIYSHIMKQYWYLNLCSYNDTYGYTENCDIFSKYAYDAHQYVFKISNSNDNRHSIIISLDLLEYLNIKNLLSICHSNIKIKNKRDIFQKIKGFYLDYHSKDYDDKFIKEIPKQNRIEEMRGLIIKDINNIHPDKFKFLKAIHINYFEISQQDFNIYIIDIAKYFYTFPKMNFIFCYSKNLCEYVLNSRKAIKKRILKYSSLHT